MIDFSMMGIKLLIHWQHRSLWNLLPKSCLTKFETVSVSSTMPIKQSAISIGFAGFILFHNKQHPNKTEPVEVEAFLTHLAVKEHVAASAEELSGHFLILT